MIKLKLHWGKLLDEAFAQRTRMLVVELEVAAVVVAVVLVAVVVLAVAVARWGMVWTCIDGRRCACAVPWNALHVPRNARCV